MFIIRGVSEQSEFKTLTRKEIGKIEWVKIQYILDNKDKFSALFPLIEGLVKFIDHIKKTEEKKDKFQEITGKFNEWTEIQVQKQIQQLEQILMD